MWSHYQKKNEPNRTLGDYEEVLIIQCIFETPSVYLDELQYQLLSPTGTWIKCATIRRTLKRLGFSHKKFAMLHYSKVKKKDWNSWQKWQV